MTRRLSVVCPVFNEELAVPLFYERFVAATAGLAERYEIELIFTNNRSTDGTRDCVLALRAKDPRVQLLTMSKNVGYQYSVQAGLKQASGDAVVVIDADCEDPPELIPAFVERWEEGFDVVYGIRDKRPEPLSVTIARKLFYRINRTLADSDIILDMAEFALLGRNVRDAVVCSRSTFPFIRAEIAHWGFRRIGIPYDRQPRIAGQTHYDLMSMTRFAVAGILSSTTAPLRLALYALPAVVLAAALGTFAFLAWGSAWAMALAVFVNLVYLDAVAAAVALYLARTYRNVIGRPGVAIDWSLSATNQPPELSPNALPRLWPDR